MIIEDILLQAGVDYDPVRGSDEDVLMPCPFCVGDSDLSGDRKVCGVNLYNGKAHCFRCDWKSGSVVFTARSLCEAYGINFSWRLRLSAAAQAERVISEKPSKPYVPPIPCGMPDGYEAFTFSDDSIERKALRYLKKRDIGRDAIERYQIGYAAAGEFAWRIIFPIVADDGKVYGCTGRDFSGTSKAKYLNKLGNERMLWGAQYEADTAVLVEGITDGIRANSRLTAMPSTIAVAVLGSGLTALQLAQLSKYKRVIHFPDWDMPGVRSTMSRAVITAEAGIDTYVAVPNEMSGLDPDTLSEDVFLHGVRTAKPWGLAAKMRMRLAMTK